MSYFQTENLFTINKESRQALLADFNALIDILFSVI